MKTKTHLVCTLTDEKVRKYVFENSEYLNIVNKYLAKHHIKGDYVPAFRYIRKDHWELIIEEVLYDKP